MTARPHEGGKRKKERKRASIFGLSRKRKKGMEGKNLLTFLGLG